MSRGGHGSWDVTAPEARTGFEETEPRGEAGKGSHGARASAAPKGGTAGGQVTEDLPE